MARKEPPRGVCADCGGSRTQRARRCRPCANVHRDYVPTTPEAREAMRAAALRRYAEVPARRQQATDLWRQGMTIIAIAQAVGVGERRVRVYLRLTGAR